MHCYSHRLLEALREAFGDSPPDLIECSDYLAEARMPLDARRGGDQSLANTLVAVRLHTSAEIAQVLDGHLDPSFDGRITRELERRMLHDADTLVYSGGDILATYQRYYGADALAPAERIRYPLDRVPHDALPPAPATARCA